MDSYTIRSGFTINILGDVYEGGDEVELTPIEFELHKHKLEGVEDDFVSPSSNNSNSNGLSCYPAPYIDSIEPSKILTGATKTISIFGSFFTPNTTVEISAGNVDSIDFISDNKLQITVSSTTTSGNYDLVFDNGQQTIVSQAINFFDLPNGTVDLRLGGADFSSAAIEMRSGMSFTRTEAGLYFSGSSPWSSWARFVGDDDAWVWNRSSKKKLSWIFENSAAFMLGIGSRANDPSNNRQYYQAEILSYAQSNTRIGLLYGNSGTPGDSAIGSFSAVKSAEDTIKAVWSQNGENGGMFTVYKLPDSSISNWFDETNKLGEVVISGFGADEPNIMPSCIPENGTSSLFIGFILEDE